MENGPCKERMLKLSEPNNGLTDLFKVRSRHWPYIGIR